MSKVHNFSAGPSILPQEVIKQAAEAVINFNNLNLSLLEISHRSKDFIAVMDKAKALVKELLNVPDGYSILFLQGGASLGFLQVPFNYMKVNGKAAYVNTGVWATKAQKEAKGFGEVIEVTSSKDKNFSYIPKNYQIPNDADYLHITSNNTIFGTQFKNFPISRIPMIADMSSDIFSKKIDVSQFDMIYAGAQKNMGPAGTILFIVKDSSLGKTGREIPTMLDFRSHIKGESMFNTPPVFAVYVSMLTLQWLKDNGGVEWMEGINQQKADLMYSEIDNNPMFEGTANKADRSNMNATFVLKNESLTEEFNKMWKEANISGIVGHRDVGGYRASMYNALPLASVQALVDVMKAFAVKFG